MALKVFARSALVLAMAVGLGALSGCKEETPEELVASAKTNLAGDGAATALVQLKSALQKDPSHAEARFLFGALLLRSGNGPQATVELSKARELGFPDDAVVPPLAKALFESGKVKQLVEQFGHVKLGRAASMAELKATLAAAYWSEENAAAASAEVDQALAAVPNYPPALLLRAHMKAASGDADGARAVVQALLAEDPKNFRALFFSGVLWLNGQQDPKAARRDFEKAIEIEPRYAEAHKALFMLNLRESNKAAAIAQYEKLHKAVPKGVITDYLATVVAFLNNDLAKARELMQRLQRYAPDAPPLLFLAGQIEYQDHALVKAETFLLKGLQKEPDSQFARRLLAKAYVQDGQIDKAQAILAPALGRKDVDAETLSVAGEVQQMQGNLKQAEAYFAAAAKMLPNDSRNRSAIAVLKLNKGDPEGLMELELLAKNSDDPYSDIVLISEKLRREDFTGAMKAAEALEKKLPGKAYPIHMKARVHERIYDIPGARAAHERALAVDPLYYMSASRLATLDIADKNYSKAASRFDAILKAEPGHLRALMAVANIRQRAGAPTAEVAERLQQAIQKNPAEVPPRVRLIELYLGANDTRAALEAANAANAAIPENPAIINALGGVQLRAGDLSPAMNSFSKLALLEPKSPYPFVRQAEVHMVEKDRKAAVRALTRALQVSPNYLLAQRSLVAIQMLDRKYDDALKVVRLVQSQRPNEDIGFLLEGDIEASRSNWDASIRAYKAALAKSPASESATKLHAVLASAGRAAEAAQFADSWMKQQADDAQFLMYMGDRSMNVAQYADAEGWYRKAIKLKPNHAVAYGNLAVTRLKQKQADATEFAQKANELAPKTPLLLDVWASALSAAGQYDKAVSVERQAIELAPDKPQLVVSLAKIYIQAGQKSKARAELQKLADSGKVFAGSAEVSKLLASL